MREDLEALGPVRLRTVEDAQQRIVNVIRKLEQAEEIDLGLGLQLAVKVLRMNVDHLKNAFGLIMSQVGVLIGPESTS